MATRWRFLRPVFRASRLQHISDLHSKFALRPHRVLCRSIVDIHSATAEIRRGKEEEEEEEEEETNGKNIMSASAT